MCPQRPTATNRRAHDNAEDTTPQRVHRLQTVLTPSLPRRPAEDTTQPQWTSAHQVGERQQHPIESTATSIYRSTAGDQRPISRAARTRPRQQPSTTHARAQQRHGPATSRQAQGNADYQKRCAAGPVDDGRTETTTPPTYGRDQPQAHGTPAPRYAEYKKGPASAR